MKRQSTSQKKGRSEKNHPPPRSPKSKPPQKIKNSKPPGVLNAGQIGRFKTIREDIVELAINSIEPFTLIPDFRDPTESIHPIIIKSPTICRCVDGWNLIESAKAAGNSSIRCHVFEIENHSDTEFAIRKVSVRTKPHGGTCSYPETLRNTRILAQIIMAEKEDLVVFSHGGARRGNGFNGNREDDLPEILAERLGKRRTTINTYINQSRFLNDDVFNALITADVGRSFFESCRVNKRTLIKNMESNGTEEGQITATVSTKMLDWLDEFLRTGKIVTDYGEDDGDAQSDGNSDDNEDDEQPIVGLQEDEIFQHQTLVDTDDTAGPPEEDVKTEIRAVILSLTAIVEQSPIEIDAGINTLNDQISKLADIMQRLMDIQDHSESNRDKEAA